MELTSNQIDQMVACFDPECMDERGHRSWAEPEQDGDVTFYACQTCGGEFGYRRMTPVGAAGTCAAGISAETRSAASQGMRRALTADGPPLFQIRRSDASAT